MSKINKSGRVEDEDDELVITLIKYDLPKNMRKSGFNTKPLKDPALVNQPILETKRAINVMIDAIFKEANIKEIIEALPTAYQMKKEKISNEMVQMELHQFGFFNKMNPKKIADAVNSAKGRVGRMVERTFNRSAQKATQTVGEKNVPNQTDEMLIVNTKNTIETLVDNVNDDIQLQLSHLIHNARSGNISREQFVIESRKIRKKARNRSEMIGVTEVVKLVSDTTEKRMKEMGYKFWRWSSASERIGNTVGKGGRVCPICHGIHGKIVPIGFPFGFLPDGKPIVKPPDPHPRCRCSVTPVTRKRFLEQ